MGSGHILVYAFDVLMQIYESAGYSQREAAKSILEHNIYGLDIDDRAFQLAYFAVMMKARQYNRRIFNDETDCHVYSIQESNTVNRDQLKYFGAGLSHIEKNDAINQITGLLDTFMDAKEYGSILNIDICNWDLLCRFVSETNETGQMSVDSIGLESSKEQLQHIIKIGQAMAQKYDIVVTNPPYMGSKGMSSDLAEYVQEYYYEGRYDLFAAFLQYGVRKTKTNGFSCMVTMQSWMFLSSFEALRATLTSPYTLTSLLHMGNMVMGIAFGTAVSVFRNGRVKSFRSRFNYIETGYLKDGIPERFPYNSERDGVVKADSFSVIPGMPIAYWAGDKMLSQFDSAPALGEIYDLKQGLITADNNRFLRYWQEIDIHKMGIALHGVDQFVEAKYKWLPYTKGGDYRKWYGNNALVVNWENDGFEIKNFKDGNGKQLSRPQNIQYFMNEGGSWSIITNGDYSIRYTPSGFGFDARGSMLFSKQYSVKYAIALLCSKVGAAYLEFLSPTVSFEVGSVSKVPFIFDKAEAVKIEQYASKCIEICKNDWDSRETSWEYIQDPLVQIARNSESGSLSLQKTFLDWKNISELQRAELKSTEELINQVFIEIYQLSNRVTPLVEDKELSVKVAEVKDTICAMISYAVGCMFGRYSLDVPGLAYAGGDWDDSKYKSFIPDKDNILPITDEAYFEDDIVGLFCGWLKKVYGADTLEENLDFIAKSLGTKGEVSREVIRNYFLNDFFKNHCATYSVTGSGKRPIYWLFDSGKQNGFKALIYMHRYDENTIGNLRIDYLHRMQRVYDSEIARMQDTIENSTDAREVTVAEKRKEKLLKQLKETKEYDEKIAHLALARIPIDLDDGVKVNYEKLQTGTDGKKLEVLAKI